MECNATVGKGSVRVVFDGGFSCGDGILGCWYKEERRGKVRTVPHKTLENCYQEISHRSGVPLDDVRSSANGAIKAAKDAAKPKKAKK